MNEKPTSVWKKIAQNQYVKLVLGNLISFLVILFVVNLLSAIALYFIDNDILLFGDSRTDLPNYDASRAHAEEVFLDYERTSTQYEPFIGWSRLPYQGKTTVIGPEGDRLCPPPAPGASKTAHFFGGSTMWGTGSDDSGTIPAQFQALSPDFRAVNHGETGFNSRQGLDKLLNLLVQGDTLDLVVFYDGVNDIYYSCQKGVDELPTHARETYLRDAARKNRDRSYARVFRALFLDNILALAVKINQSPAFQQRKDRCDFFDCLCKPEKVQAVANELLTNWSIAHDLVEARGGRFIGILQPSPYLGDPRLDHISVSGMRQSIDTTYQLVYHEIQRQIDERDLNWAYDFTDVLDGDEYFYIDYCHLSPNGNRKVAERLSAIVGKPLVDKRER